jgi:predicted Zn-dependent peptidase
MSSRFARKFGAVRFFCFLAAAAIVLMPSVLPAAELLQRLAVRRLPNGMLFLVYPRNTSPTFSGHLLIDVGSSDEHLGITGIAHMFEHMAFKGTPTVGTTDYAAEKPLLDEIERAADELTQLRFAPKADPRRIAELSVRYKDLTERHRALTKKEEFSEIYTRNGGQDLNASTSYDFTNYFVSLPSNRLELWMWMESERLLHPVLREFYIERDVILEERNMRVENSPRGKLWETFLALSFIAHPYGYPILGWPQDMARLTQREAEDFRGRFYVPANMIAAVVGDVDPAAVFSLAERYFGRLPAAPADRLTPAAEPRQIGERRFEIRRPANPSVLIAYHKPPLPDPADYIADVTEQVLTEGRTSRLYRLLVLQKQLATGVGAFSTPGDKYANLVVISATPRAPHTVREVEEAIYAELDRLAKEGPTALELEKVKNRLDVDVQRSLRSNDGLAGMLAYYTGLTRDPRYLEKYIAKLKSVTANDVARFTSSTLTAENRTVGWITKNSD